MADSVWALMEPLKRVGLGEANALGSVDGQPRRRIGREERDGVVPVPFWVGRRGHVGRQGEGL